MKSITQAGIVLGLGLGGFLDGIVAHQILGWHHLVCLTETCQPDSVAALQFQQRLDGFFHLATWMLTLAGVTMLFRAGGARTEWRGRDLAGGMLAGWGA